VQVVDVREPDEWDAGRIDGSIHIPLGNLPAAWGELDHDRPVVTVCRSGSRSAGAAQDLAAQSFDASNLDGGLLAWVDAGLPLVDSKGGSGRVAETDEDGGERSFQAELMAFGAKIDEHFGGREASPEEIEQYLRDLEE
jgi:rhodanese-related sulfurtransferase